MGTKGLHIWKDEIDNEKQVIEKIRDFIEYCSTIQK